MTTTKQQKLNAHIGFDLEKEADKLWKQIIKQNNKGELRPIRKLWITTKPTIIVHQCNRMASSGSYYTGTHTITLSLGRNTAEAWETLAHELNHSIGLMGHDEKFYKSLKAIVEKRWNTRISFYEVGRYGYEVDAIILGQLIKGNLVNFEKPSAKAVK